MFTGVIIDPHWNLEFVQLLFCITYLLCNNRSTLEFRGPLCPPVAALDTVIIDPHWNLEL